MRTQADCSELAETEKSHVIPDHWWGLFIQNIDGLFRSSMAAVLGLSS
jgi:hypothetical protein